MSQRNSLIYLVDDDRRILSALTRLLQCEGWLTASFTSTSAFLQTHDPEVPAAWCLI